MKGQGDCDLVWNREVNKKKTRTGNASEFISCTQTTWQESLGVGYHATFVFLYRPKTGRDRNLVWNVRCKKNRQCFRVYLWHTNDVAGELGNYKEQVSVRRRDRMEGGICSEIAR